MCQIFVLLTAWHIPATYVTYPVFIQVTSKFLDFLGVSSFLDGLLWDIMDVTGSREGFGNDRWNEVIGNKPGHYVF